MHQRYLKSKSSKKRRTHVSVAPGERFRRARRRRRRIYIAFLIILFFGAIWGLHQISYAKEFRIKDIVVSGANRVPQKWIAVDADTLLKEPLWNLFSRHNRILVPEKRIAEKILERPEIASVEVDVNDGILEISVVERTSVILMCSEFTKCFEMDDQGMLFAVAKNDSSQIRIISHEPSKVLLGTNHLSSQKIEELFKMVEAVKEIKLEIKEIRLDSDDELTLIPKSGSHIKLAWKTLKNAPVSLQTILASGEISTSTLTASQYIDLRFENSVYYK